MSGVNAFIEEIFKILHPSLSTISWAKICVGSNVPMKFRLNTNSTPLGSKSKKEIVSASISPCSKYSLSVVARGLFPPAPLISHVPRSAKTASCVAIKLSFSKTFVLYAFATPPFATISAATFCAASSFKSRTATLAPA